MKPICTRKLHVIPMGGGEPLHSTNPRCFCNPFDDEEGMVVHHSTDKREQFERNNPDAVDMAKGTRCWGIVVEVWGDEPRPEGLNFRGFITCAYAGILVALAALYYLLR